MSYAFETLMIHGAADWDKSKSMTPPIYQTNAYHLGNTNHAEDMFALKAAGDMYTRLSNPTVSMLENRIAVLEDGAAALAFSSGHAALFAAVTVLADAGDEIVSSICIYGGAISLLGTSLKKLGIKTIFVDPDDFSAWEAAITDKTKAFFVETIGNPNANVADIERIAKIAHSKGIPLIVDGTFTTPYLQKSKQFGADIVVHSATKFLCGHGSSMAGLLVDLGTFNFSDNPRFPGFNMPDQSYHGIVYSKDAKTSPVALKGRAQVLRDFGGCLSPFNAYLILQGIETLSLRMERHCENALAIAQYLELHKNVSSVSYPALKSNKYYDLIPKYLPNGASSIFTFEIKGKLENCRKFIDSLSLFSNVANVGDLRSLAIHPATTTHSQLTNEQMEKGGITSQTVRLSIGLENKRDLITDLEQALSVL